MRKYFETVGSTFKFYATIFFVVLVHLSFAQKTFVSGVVNDSTDNISLPGVNIIIEGTTIGVTTNMDGEYSIELEQKVSTLVFSFMGYRDKKIEVDLSEGGNLTLNVLMSVDAVGLEEVVVTGQLEGQRKAISQQRIDDRISQIVSEDKIKELPDVNAAEAIARLPGVALVRSGGEGQKVIVRGLDPKFTAITLNGIRLPSNDRTDRSINLSVISPELLSGIEVFKTPLPDMDAEAIAGTVNLRLKKAPADLHVLAKGLWGFNQITNTYQDYRGLLQISNRFFNNKLGFVLQGSYGKFNRGGELIRNVWNDGFTDDDGVTQLNGRRLEQTKIFEERTRFNGSISLDYSINNRNDLSFIAILSRTNRDGFNMSVVHDPQAPSVGYQGLGFDITLDLQHYMFSGLHNLGNGSWELDWTVATSITGGDQPYYYNLLAVDTRSYNAETLDPTGHPRNYPNSAPQGVEEVFLYEGTNQVDQTHEISNRALINLKKSFSFSSRFNAYIKAGAKYYTINKDRVATDESELFYYLGSEEAALARARYEELSGTTMNTNGGLLLGSNFSSPNSMSITNELGNTYEFPLTLDRDKVRQWYDIQRPLLNNDRNSMLRNYEANESVMAGYVMMKLMIGDDLSIIPGVRYEYSDNSYQGPILDISGWYGVDGNITDTTTYQNYGEWLPGLHIKYQVNKWFDIRASYSTTIARPNFNWVSPTARISRQEVLRIQSGNPNLKHATSQNYDLMTTLFHPQWGMFSVNGFYKSFDNFFTPREYQLVDSATAAGAGWPGYEAYLLTSYINLPESKVYGLEFDLQTNLSVLPGAWKGIVISLNYTRQWSETTDYKLSSKTETVGFPPVTTVTYTSTPIKSPLPSMTPHLFRSSIGFDYKGFSIRFSSLYQAGRIVTLNVLDNFEDVELDFWRFDAQVKQKVGKHWSVFVTLNNISSQEDIEYKAIRKLNSINTISRYGMTGSVSLQYQLK
ncbi:TonB-dependent receptor [Mariniphaga sediminis]|uniref:TonB-dependent receptor n=1 Tax=Mariniphaga sediminis TaxID=1628158 RepID=UPI0035696E7C